MARYIDADKAIELHNGELWAWDVPDLKEFLAEVPTADVVPKSEVEKLTIELLHVKEDYGDIFATLIRTKNELAREIFEEIEKLTYRYLNDANYSGGDMIYDIAELKKKYTEVEK